MDTDRIRKISIHAPAKGATVIHDILRAAVLFQFTLPRRERPQALDDVRTALEISIHAPAKGATIYLYGNGFCYKNFNSRSREGSDLSCVHYVVANYISIHAPAKGATTAGRITRLPLQISIHAPAKGATTDGFMDIPDGEQISIHAPAKGATGCRISLWDWQKISIHAPAKGATHSRLMP